MASSWTSVETFVESTGRDVPDVDSERYVSYSLDDLYPTWQAQAHCKGVGVNYYFGDEDEQPTMSIKQVRQASKLCDVCPVFEECLRWSIEQREYYGVWAGTSGRTRRKIFKLVDNGDATVDEVVEGICHGQGDRYRNAALGRGEDPSGDRLGHDARGEARAGDLRHVGVRGQQVDHAGDQRAAQG